jgi:hypothetical protein
MNGFSGQQILNNIPRKNVPIPTGGPSGTPFTMRTNGHDTILGFEGSDYYSPFTDSGLPPMSGQFNNATQPQIPFLKNQLTDPRMVVPGHTYVKVQPETTTVLSTFKRPNLVVRNVGGPSANANTPFHPTRVSIQKRTSAPAPVRPTDKYKTAAAVATGTPKTKNSLAGHFQFPVTTGSFLPVNQNTLLGHAHADANVSRWSVVKRGAAG